MFKKNFNHDSQTSSFIGAKSKFQGEILFDGILRLDGKMKGKIIAKSYHPSTLFIGKNAEIEADVVADNVIVYGKLSGRVYAPQRLELKTNGRYEGMVFTLDLVLQKNCFFHGRSFMMKHLTAEERNKIKIGFQKGRLSITPNLLEKFEQPSSLLE